MYLISSVGKIEGLYNHVMGIVEYLWKYVYIISLGFTTTSAISAYHHQHCESDHGQACDKVYQWLVADRWLSPSTPVSSTNKTDCDYIAKILLKVALNTITLTLWLAEIQRMLYIDVDFV